MVLFLCINLGLELLVLVSFLVLILVLALLLILSLVVMALDFVCRFCSCFLLLVSLCYCICWYAPFVADMWYWKSVGKDAGCTGHRNLFSAPWTKRYSLPSVFAVIIWTLHADQSWHWINTCWKVLRCSSQWRAIVHSLNFELSENFWSIYLGSEHSHFGEF